MTEVLYPFSGLDKIPAHIVENAGRRGTVVHGICEGIVRGLGEWDVTEEARPYVDSFKQWWKEDIKVIDVEKRFYDDEFMITGQVDLIIETSEGHMIIDYKTSAKPSKTWALQGSAYSYMARKQGYNIQGTHFLHLDKNGKPPKVYIYGDQFDLYRSCLDVFNHFYKKK